MTVCAPATVGPAATARRSAVNAEIINAEMVFLMAYSICIGEPELTSRARNSTRVCRLRSYWTRDGAEALRLFRERKIAALTPSRNHIRAAMPAAAALQAA